MVKDEQAENEAERLAREESEIEFDQTTQEVIENTKQMNDVNEKQFVSQTNSSVNLTKAVQIESNETISVNSSEIVFNNQSGQDLGNLSSNILKNSSNSSDFQDQNSLI